MCSPKADTEEIIAKHKLAKTRSLQEQYPKEVSTKGNAPMLIAINDATPAASEADSLSDEEFFDQQTLEDIIDDNAFLFQQDLEDIIDASCSHHDVPQLLQGPPELHPRPEHQAPAELHEPPELDLPGGGACGGVLHDLQARGGGVT